MEILRHRTEASVAGHNAPREVELKLELASGHVADLLNHPLLARARPLPEQSGVLFAVYHDTVDHALRRAGLTLRIRSRNGRHVQTIKAEGEDRSLALDRAEWECDTDGGIDFPAAAGTPLASFVPDERSRDLIRPVFTVETDRRAFLVEHQGAMVELALDQAIATAGSQDLFFSEIELELKQGQASSLFDLAGKLVETVPLRLSLVTKSERGYTLTGAAPPEPVPSGTIELSPDTPCAEAFQTIARSCLSEIVRNEALFRRTREPAALHQMRVGFRRLKAALSLFKAMLDDRETKAIKEELRWAGRQLGPARNLDVLLTRLKDMKHERAHPLSMKAERARTEAYGALLDALASPRFMRAVLQTAAWIETGRWLTRGRAGTRQQPVGDLAAEELPQRWNSIRKRTRQLADLEPDERHRVRIRVKKLRYIAEFLQGLFRRKPAKKRHGWWLARLKRLQDALGEMNDMTIGADLLPDLAQADSKQARKRGKKLLSLATETARDLRQADPFWA